MKRRVIVEIECPEGFDAVWDEDQSGIQVFHDTMVVSACAGRLEFLMGAIEKCREKGMSDEEMENDRYYQFINRKNDITLGCRAVGYIDDEDNIHIYDHTQHKWVS